MTRPRSRFASWCIPLALLASACSGTPGGERPAEGTSLSALPANFDLAVDSPQAFLLGLAGVDRRPVAFGSIGIAFSYLGPVGRPLAEPDTGPRLTAHYRPVAGTRTGESETEPRLVDRSDVAGVYATDPMTFPDAGHWEAAATFELDGRTEQVTAAFEVLEDHLVPAIGEPAPRTDNPLPGAVDVAPAAIDSRADTGGSIPDPELHRTSVAAAIAAGRPATVVIATPALCESRMCGPVTDATAAVAGRYGERMDFIHLEVFADVDAQQIAPAAAEWIVGPGADGNEPWVFVIDADGIIRHRFDNVVDEPLIEAAVRDVLA